MSQNKLIYLDDLNHIFYDNHYYYNTVLVDLPWVKHTMNSTSVLL